MSNVPKLRFKEFRGEWEEKRFEDFSKVIDGDRGVNYPKSGEFYENEYCLFLNTKNVTKRGFSFQDNQFITEKKDNELSKGKLERGDIILTTRGSVGNFAFYSNTIIYENMRINSGMVIIRANKSVDKNFIYKASFSPLLSKQINVIAFGSAQPQLTVKEIKKIRIKLPSKLEQEKIASFLTSVDTKIEQLTKKEALLQKYKKGVMNKIFNQEVRFKDDDGSEFPEWEEKRLGDIGEIVTGKTPSTTDKDLWNGDIRFITPTDITDNIKYQSITQRTVVRQNKMKVLPIGSIVYTCIASIGKMQLTLHPSITNQQINSIIVNINHNNEFIYYSLLNMTPYIKSTQSNTTLPIINKTEFSKFIVGIPSIQEQTKIANFLSSIDKKIELTTKELNSTKEFKKALLQQMFV